MKNRPAIFLDRDGVVIEDVHLATRQGQVRFSAASLAAFRLLRDVDRPVVVVSNQTVVGRGLASEVEVDALHAFINEQLRRQTGRGIDRFYFCPHHPNATLVAYRCECECRKPRAGMLLTAARELDLDLSSSVMVGDRVSDIAAGRRAGCRTIHVQTGAHLQAPIEAPDFDPNVEADYVCQDLLEAVQWILN
jgi:D-glycero-D-manno-heptose 1,7-bisphosphate phosphatase